MPMKTYIKDSEVWVKGLGVEFPTRFLRPQARQIANDIRNAITRDPRSIRQTWSTRHGQARFEAQITKADPWPTMIFHDAVKLRPTEAELNEFLWKLTHYGMGAK